MELALRISSSERFAPARHFQAIAPSRRAGDVAQCWSGPGKAESELGWRAERGLAG